MEISPAIISSTLDEEEGEGHPLGVVDVELRTFEIGPAQHGARLDRALTDLVPEFSRSYLQQLIADGAVTLCGACCTRPATKVRVPQQGVIALRPTPQSQAFKPEQMKLDVRYEDAHLLVINKPAGLVVHPAPGNWSGTLLNGLLARYPESVYLPRAGIVHRLDKDTSGLMVVARTRACMDALIAAIAARNVVRQYVALAHGAWQGALRREVDKPIGRDPRNRLRMAVVDLAHQAGKPALTVIELMDNTATSCLVRCTLSTGRTHQIRVHMASLGHPLVADTLYGGTAVEGLTRQGLHAWRLTLTHPVSAQVLQFESDPPQDMCHFMRRVGLRYNAAQSMV